MMTNKFWTILVSMATINFAVLCAQMNKEAMDSCVFPGGETGSCVSVKDCQAVIDLLPASRTNGTVLSYLRRILCGFDGDVPKVCCPDLKMNLKKKEDGAGTRSLPTVELSVLPSPPQCGESNMDFSRIVGGRPASLGQWPWIAAIGYTSSDSPKDEIYRECGGVLITDRHILTAAHCVYPGGLDLVNVRLGDLNLNDSVSDGATPVDVDVMKKILHEDFNPKNLDNDIAILKLGKSVTFTTLIQPICLPQTPELKSMNLDNKNPYVAGWGRTQFRGARSNHLMEVQIPIVNNTHCGINHYPNPITKMHLCAGYPQGGMDACQGDSGGPLMLPRGAWFYSIGIVSGGYKCAEPNKPGIYVRITEYIDWIAAHIRD